MSENNNILPGDPLIDHYKALAAEVVARGVSDYVTLKIFLRDDPKGRWKKMYTDRAECNYNNWIIDLKNHEATKRTYRSMIKKNVELNQKEEAEIRQWEEDLGILEPELEIAKLNLTIAKGRPRGENVFGRTKTEAVQELTSAVKALEGEVARLKLRIEKSQDSINKRNTKIKGWRRKIQLLKQLEEECHSKITAKENRKQMLALVNSEIERYEDWFYSGQFEILAEISPDSVIARTEKRVAEGLERPMRDFYFLEEQQNIGRTNAKRKKRKKKGNDDGKGKTVAEK